jgi:putative heme-binding domain-containing protein
VSTATDTRPYPGLKPGYSGSPGGTGADLAEFRIWNIARTPEEIRSAANLALSGPKPGLVMNGSGIHWPPLHGTARIERTADGPPVLGEAAAAALEAKFARFRGLASGPGDALQGRVVFTATCAPCHSVRGEGGRVGPVLDGAGAAGVEALLRNVLTPDAAMEAGYRRFRVETSGGETLEGQLAAQDADTVTLRQPNTEDQKFRRSDLRRAGFVRGSVMPSGLLEALPEPRVADLFAYLRTLR